MNGRALKLEVDLDAIRANARAVMQAVGPSVTLYACLKGDAYGCGIRLVAPALQREGVRAFAAGALEDAIAIRESGADGEILLYPNCLPDSEPLVQANRLTITLSSIEEATAWNVAARGHVSAFIKVDVGALRAGVLPREATRLAQALHGLPRLQIVGAFAHLHLPDPVGMQGHARHQLQQFVVACTAIEAAGIALPTKMVSGTAALLQFPEMDLDAVDPGRVLFGLGFAATVRPLRLRPAIRRWVARLLLVKDVRPEDVAPFVAPFDVSQRMRIGLLPFGWGDGLQRPLPPDASVLIRGRRALLLPPSHFEHVRVDLTNVPDAAYGDEVVLVGQQGEQSISLEQLASWCGKDPLHFIGTLPRHIERVAAVDTVH